MNYAPEFMAAIGLNDSEIDEFVEGVDGYAERDELTEMSELGDTVYKTLEERGLWSTTQRVVLG
jgi:hypothetical protein